MLDESEKNSLDCGIWRNEVLFDFPIPSYLSVRITPLYISALKKYWWEQYVIRDNGDCIVYCESTNGYCVKKSTGEYISCELYFSNSNPSGLFSDYIFMSEIAVQREYYWRTLKDIL